MTFIWTLGKWFDPILSPILSPLFYLPNEASLAIVTFLIILLTTLIYKKATDQELMKSLKAEIKEIQKEVKELGATHPKASEKQKEMMGKSMKQMRESFKPMIWTMLPILVLFGWLSMHFAYAPIMPDSEFSVSMLLNSDARGIAVLDVPDDFTLLTDATVDVEPKDTNLVMWKLKGPTGKYYLNFGFNDNSYSKDVLITNGREYAEPIMLVNKDNVKQISIDNTQLRFFGLSWFWAYVIMSVIFNMVLRKAMGVH